LISSQGYFEIDARLSLIFGSPGAMVEKRKIIDSLHAEAGSRFIGEREAGPDQLLLGAMSCTPSLPMRAQHAKLLRWLPGA